MTDKLDNQSRIDLINYKLEKAVQTLNEADVLATAKFYNAAVNRLYYGAYYAATALMLDSALETMTHKGVKTMLGLKFIQPGIIDRQYGRIYQKLFDCRQAGDYEDFVYYDEETFKDLRPQAEDFVRTVSKYLQK